MIIVADAADNVCGAKYFMWSHLASHDKQFSPHDKIVCNVEQFVMWSFGNCSISAACGAIGDCSTWHMLSCCDLCCFDAKSILSRFTHFCVEQKITKNLVCGGKMTYIMYDPGLLVVGLVGEKGSQIVTPYSAGWWERESASRTALSLCPLWMLVRLQAYLALHLCHFHMCAEKGFPLIWVVGIGG